MKATFTCLLILLFCVGVNAQNYSFYGQISREVLENYLDRSITMQTLSDIQGVGNLSETERQRDISMLVNIGAKFVGRIGGWWENGYGQQNLDAIFQKVSQNVSDLKSYDPTIICQGAIFEYVSPTVNSFNIPSYVFNAFSQPIISRTFNYSSMIYPGPASQYTIYARQMTETERQTIPDITSLETQMWIYCMATRFIDAGCEAIHFGQAEIMNLRDVGNQNWWSLLSKIRAYSINKNRGTVLCDAHSPSGGIYYDSNPNSPLPIYDRQLVFDFPSSPLGLAQYNNNCTLTLQPSTIDPNHSGVFYTKSKGGKNPQGWDSKSNPFLVELDNGGIGDIVGCNGSPSWFTYGWDDISWFSQQPEDYRNDFLKYAYYKVKCIDLNGHFEMPGRRNINTVVGGTESLYRANTTFFNQQQTITDLWNGVYNISNEWTHYSFTQTAVMNPPNPSIANSNLVFVGNDKIFYISTDQRIHGYVKYNNAWVTVSPSWSAYLDNNQDINSQVLAAGDLTASPDGSKLIYRGSDGFIYGFNINNIWNYSYFALPTNEMIDQNVRVATDLIFAQNDAIYYIGNEFANNKRRVHGFIYYNNSWVTVSPSWSANDNGSSINTQVEADGSLALNSDKSRLYYRGTDGFLYYYLINNNWSYNYFSIPSYQMASQNIKATGKIILPQTNRIYYEATELNSNTKRIHGFIYYNNSWQTVSPSWSANDHGFGIYSQNEVKGNLCASPDGTSLSYIGIDQQIHNFSILDDWDYVYKNLPVVSSPNLPFSSLQYNSSNELFYISSNLSYNSNEEVHSYKLQQQFCLNTTIANVENYVMSSPHHPPIIRGGDSGLTNEFESFGSMKTLDSSQLQTIKEKDGFKIFPNPNRGVFNINLPTSETFYVTIIEAHGHNIVYKKIVNNNSMITLPPALANGVYFVFMQGVKTNSIFSGKIILIR
jgi:hypothetical protein